MPDDRDYPVGTTYQPDEPPLQMTVDQLVAVRDAAAATADRPGVHVYDDFLIFNGPCTGAVLRQFAAAQVSRLRNRLVALVSRRGERFGG